MISNGDFEEQQSFPFRASMSPGVEYNVTSEGPFAAFDGRKYLIISFGSTAAKSKRDDTEIKTFNITQDVTLPQSASYEFSARAQKSGSTTASCNIQLCVDDTCSYPVGLETNWTRAQVTYSSEQDSPTFDVMVSCRGDGYVGLDGLAAERVVSRIQTVYMPSNQTYSQTAAPRVTETVYSNITQERTVVSTQPGETIATVRYSNISVTVLATATTNLPGGTLTTFLPRETTTNRETLTLPQMNGTQTSGEYITATVSLSPETETRTAVYTTAIYSNATFTMPASTIICRQTDD
ncbi:hypothetical protein LTR56_001847 [Elasticomyces elasticus]|nr:hypothetical protein LTR56_001847 [Elasticomyces elasticus]KAK3668802.1 hypothetical protein LTR22_000282 [Elasticomyces elasticus]KAK4909026.1 hypothetical protein LTR49_022180 [Elasticomyces elasticus]KAK5757961.1 hypothetical protein LTS12_012000 [Elasticomyces elasticus]